MNPPQILQVYRDFLKPGSDTAFRKIEVEAARICSELQCPHPYLGIESLNGPKEVWWLNGYGSQAEQQQVFDEYRKNEPLLAALGEIATGKRDLVLEPVEVFADYRCQLSRGVPWALGQGRFLAITATREGMSIDGTVFEAPDGTRFIVMPAQTDEEAGAIAAAAGPETRVFAVRPYWSFPAMDWVTADPDFWSAK